MSLELIYTSVSRGLSPGSSGFCTAAATGGMSRQVTGKLEALSGYSFHFNLSDPKANLNPVDYAHTQVRIGSETLSVLSRVAFCGADYSGRTNKIAHHFLLEHGEQLPGGPAWMMRQMVQKTFVAGYSGEPKNLPKRDLRAALPPAPQPAGPAAAWQKTTGDAGWAGMLVKAFRENPKVPAFVVFSPGQELLPLFEESLALLPPEDRWQIGFATYYTALPVGCQYHWRGVLAGSAAVREMARFPNATLIDLTASPGHAPDNIFTEAARTGAVLPPVRVAERPRIRVVERAPQPVATVSAAAAEEVGTLETERRAAGAPTPGVWPSPAQLSVLMARARRARWVKPLQVAVIVLALSSVGLTALYFHERQQSAMQAAPGAEGPVPSAPTPGPTEAIVPSDTTPAPPPAPKIAQGDLHLDLQGLTGLKEKVETTARNAKNQMTTAEKHANQAKVFLAKIGTNPDAGSLAEAQTNLREAESSAQEARYAANTAQEYAKSAKEQAEEVDRRINDIRPQPEDTSIKESFGALQKATAEAEKEAKASAQQANLKASEADLEVNNARKQLGEAEKKIKEVLAKAPEVEPQLKSRNEPFGPNVSPDKPPKPVWPSLSQGKRKEFPLGSGRKYAFLHLPDAVRQKVKGLPDSVDHSHRLVVQAMGAYVLEDFIAYTIDSRPFLVCEILTDVPDTRPDRIALRDWLVIEVADLEARQVYQCVMSGPDKRKTETIKVGYNGDGKLIQMAPVKFDYPWPGTLTVKVAGGDPFPLGLSKDIVLRPEGSNVSVDLKVEIKKRGDSTFEITCSSPTFANAVRTEAAKTREAWLSADANLQETNRELKTLKEGGKNEEKKANLLIKQGQQQEALTKAEEPVQKLLAAAKEAFAQNDRLIICDAWGLSVVELTLKFGGEAGPIIKSGN